MAVEWIARDDRVLGVRHLDSIPGRGVRVADLCLCYLFYLSVESAIGKSYIMPCFARALVTTDGNRIVMRPGHRTAMLRCRNPCQINGLRAELRVLPELCQIERRALAIRPSNTYPPSACRTPRGPDAMPNPARTARAAGHVCHTANMHAPCLSTVDNLAPL